MADAWRTASRQSAACRRHERSALVRLEALQRPARPIRRPPSYAPRVTSIIDGAVCPAAATGPDNRIVAWNAAFTELAGRDDLEGHNLQDLLRCRHANGNSFSHGHVALHEMVLTGEAPAAFEIDVEPEGRPRVRVEVSVVVVFDNTAEHHRLIYLMRPRHRRRRTDAALEQLLNAGAAPPRRRASDSPSSTLTRRQLEVLGLMATGATASEMAAGLGITVNTVRTHIRAILETLGVTRQTEAVAKAVRGGLI